MQKVTEAGYKALLTETIASETNREEAGLVVTRDIVEAIEECYHMGWTDGLPVVPTVEYKVRQMLDYVDVKGDEGILELYMRRRFVTAEKVTACAVMSVCLNTFQSSSQPSVY